jgi:hypothetical protein
MHEAVGTSLKLAADHPLIALSLFVFVAIPLLLGWMHEARFFGECLIVGIRFFKHEVFAWREFLGRLKEQLATWKVDE